MIKNNMGGYIVQKIIILILVIPLLSIAGIAQTGTLYISSQPGEANVYIDGIYKGSTPIYNQYAIDHLIVRDIPIGSHIIKITKIGYFDWNQTIQLSSGTETINTYLEIMKGTLEISTEMGFGEVYIDGIFEGVAGWNSPLSRYLPYGSYTIEIKQEGCKDWKQIIQLQEQLKIIKSSFNCTVGMAPSKKDAEINFAFGGPSISYIAGDTLNVDVIVENTGSYFRNTFPIVLSVRDPYGNWTDLPYKSVTLGDGEKDIVYFIYNIPPSGPNGTWAIRIAVWDRITPEGNLETRYDYEEKMFNVSISSRNASVTPLSKTVIVKVRNGRFGQPYLRINTGDEVVWDNGDSTTFTIAEIDKKIDNITLSYGGKTRYKFNISGNYRFNMSDEYRLADTLDIYVVPTIIPISTTTEIFTVTSSSATPTLAITQTTTVTPTPTLNPTPAVPGFKLILAGIVIITAFLFCRR